MQLFSYYSLDECKDIDHILDKLNTLKKEGKIEYELSDRDSLKIEDIDLDDLELELLVDEFDTYYVIPDLDRSYEDDEDDFEEFDDEDY